MSILYTQSPLLVNPDLAVRIGLNQAIVLQQIHYWSRIGGSGVDHEGRRWIYNSHQEWQKQFPFWSVDTIARALRSLSEQGLVSVEQLRKADYDRTNYYSINHGHQYLQDAVDDDRNLPSSEIATCRHLSENTTETTSENNLIRGPEKCPVAEIVDLYHEILPELPSVALITKDRTQKLQSRWREHKAHQDLEFWREYFTSVKSSAFLMGNVQARAGARPFRATFDWLIAPSNFVKVVEGNYHA